MTAAQFRETVKSHGKSLNKDKLKQIFETLGLSEVDRILQSRPYEMSGGMNQRIAIAASLILEPELLLCDEITSALDVTTQAQVVALLKQLKEEGCFSAIFVTHDIALVSNLCDRIMVMKEGQCVEQGIAADVIQNPTDDYTKLLLESARRQSIREPEG
jgi:ABC-type dipeptide/oligopeptide/nickel transport system ATPase component